MTEAADAGPTWRGSSAQERRAARRRRLLDAGLQLFGTTGYTATSLTAVCAIARVSPRHFYEVFEGREQLLVEVYDELVGELGDRLGRALDRAPVELEPRVDAAISAVLDYCTTDPRRARILQLEIVRAGPAFEAHRMSVVSAFAAVLEDQHRLLHQAGQARPQPFTLVAVGVVGALNELLVQWLLSEPRIPVDDLRTALTQLVLPALRGR